jgi:hypothetical protein
VASADISHATAPRLEWVPCLEWVVEPVAPLVVVWAAASAAALLAVLPVLAEPALLLATRYALWIRLQMGHTLTRACSAVVPTTSHVTVRRRR